MKEIAEAIRESISTDSIVHISVETQDIYEAMAGENYDEAIDLRGGHYDVWGDVDSNAWRLNVRVVVS